MNANLYFKGDGQDQMAASQTHPTALDVAAENLFNYSIERNDLKYILSTLPETINEKMVSLEYEIQLLKMLTVGWAISFFLVDKQQKEMLSEKYWYLIREFSINLSSTTSMTTGQEIDYFETLKQRLDSYVTALEQAGKVSEPASVIGPVFAEKCGNTDDACAVLAGSKMFKTAVNAVKEYLESIHLQPF